MLNEIASTATALAVGLGVIELYLSRQQAITQFEDSLAAEYRTLANKISTDAFLGQPLSECEVGRSRDEFYHYFDLTNNQIFLRQIGRVKAKTWIYWRDGIRSNMERPAFAAAWADIGSKSGKDFQELRRLIREDFKSDPRRWS